MAGKVKDIVLPPKVVRNYAAKGSINRKAGAMLSKKDKWRKMSGARLLATEYLKGKVKDDDYGKC